MCLVKRSLTLDRRRQWTNDARLSCGVRAAACARESHVRLGASVS